MSPTQTQPDQPLNDQLPNDNSAELLEQVKRAVDSETPITIAGGNSKAALGNQLMAHQAASNDEATLSTLSHQGIISYEPTELVVTVRAGTRMEQLNKVLAAAGQMLPFEPPMFPGATIGGVLACGLSGPRRPFSGAARDYVLGTRIINGQAQDLSFGGQVMKNVAGYDVSRVQVGAWGTLGVLLDVSMKVLPLPELELTLKQHCKHGDLQAFVSLMRKPLPLSGAMLIRDNRYLRLSGSEAAVRAAASQLGGDVLADNTLWQSVRDQTHPFFSNARDAEHDKTLWRISLPDYAPALGLSGDWLHEWAGGQRWLLSDTSADEVFRVVAAAEGHAMRYTARAGSGEPAFQPLVGAMQTLQARVRDSFDPLRLFNRGRFHPELDVPSKLEAASA